MFASIANYFVAHGWQRGAPVAGRADKAADAPDFVPPDPKALDPVYPLALLESKGYSLRAGTNRARKARWWSRSTATPAANTGWATATLRHHPLQPFADVRDGGVAAGAGDRRRAASRGGAAVIRAALVSSLALALAACAANPPKQAPTLASSKPARAHPAPGASPYAPAQEDVSKRGGMVGDL